MHNRMCGIQLDQSSVRQEESPCGQAGFCRVIAGSEEGLLSLFSIPIATGSSSNLRNEKQGTGKKKDKKKAQRLGD